MRIEENILEILNKSEIDGNILRLGSEQLDRKDYLSVNKVLEALGGKWNRKEKGHVFDSDPKEKIQEAISTEKFIEPKKEFGMFETPLPIINRLIELAELKSDMLVLEPSAGTGAIVREVSKIASVDCVEILKENIDKFILEGYHRHCFNMDFLCLEPEDYFGKCYDRVIMNPPFSNQQDIKHVTHALKFLKPDGLLVSVMASGFTFRENRLSVDFKNLVEERNGFYEENPEKAFKESGTMVNTVIVVIPGIKIKEEMRQQKLF